MIGRLPSLSGRSVDGGQALEDALLVVFDAENVAIGREDNLQCGGLKMWQSITKSRKNTMLLSCPNLQYLLHLKHTVCLPRMLVPLCTSIYIEDYHIVYSLYSYYFSAYS